jgi:N-acylneuraminate cytidylyltransferase
MIDGHQVAALIPARGGSTAVEKKNLRSLGGKPLVAWPIDVARQAPAVDRVVVSTDDDDIAACAETYGAELEKRPPELATDEALVIDAIRYHLRKWKQEDEAASILVLLEPTCPFRATDDVERSLDQLVQTDCDSVATFCRAEVNPWRTWKIEGEDELEPFIEGADPWRPRQKLPDAYQLNGAVYAFFANRLPDDEKTLLFGKSGGVVMPEERSIDLDTEMDFIIAQSIYEHGKLSN